MAWHFEFRLSETEFDAAWNFVQRSVLARARRGPGHWPIMIASLVVGGALGVGLVQGLDAPGPWASLTIAALVASGGLSYLNLWLIRRRICSAARKAYLQDSQAGTVDVDETGLRMRAATGEGFVAWSAVADIASTAQAEIVLLRDFRHLCFPHRIFADAADLASFRAFVREMIDNQAQPHSAVDATPASPPLGAVESPPARTRDAARVGYVRSLWAGLRLAFFVRVPADQIAASPSVVAALFATAFMMYGLRDLAGVGLDGQLSPWGAPGLLLFVPVMLLAAVLVAAGQGSRGRIATLIPAFAALSVPLIGIEILLRSTAFHWLWRSRVLSDAAWFWTWLIPVWMAIASALATRSLTDFRPSALLKGLCVGTLVVALPLGMIYRDGAVWQARYDEAAEQARRRMQLLTTEEGFYQQARVLDRTLKAIAPGRPGVTDLYYVGVGGYGHQDVFMREVRAVEQLMTAKFGAAGRSATLLNNPKTVMETPIASVTALRQTLARIGSVMNPEEDILFLFMTSHGSKEHKFALELWPMQFNDLTPETLRAALDDAKIKWRVIVISACYSGGFINALRDQHTIVIAAAAPDRRSFGCSNKADWTYFGKAFFADSLPDLRRLVPAFEHARAEVGARETREKVEERSNPQIAASAEMVQKWDAFLGERRSAGTLSAHGDQTDARMHDDAQALVGLRRFDKLARDYKDVCMRQLAESSPAFYLDRDPNYFGGLNRSSPAWGELMAAWERYTEEYCSATNNASVYRKAYEAAWRELARPETIHAALAFREKGFGAELTDLENRISAAAGRHIAEAQKEAGAQAIDRFRNAQLAAIAEHQRFVAQSTHK